MVLIYIAGEIEKCVEIFLQRFAVVGRGHFSRIVMVTNVVRLLYYFAFILCIYYFILFYQFV